MTATAPYSTLATTTARLYDSSIIFVAGVLMAFGAVMVYSASVSIDGPPLDWRQWWNTPLRQCLFAMIGFVVMLATAHLDYRALAWTRPGDGWRAGSLLVLAGMLLLAVFVPGVGLESLGARRAILVWRGPPAIQFQPSEVAKVVLVIWLAALVTRPTSRFGAGTTNPSGAEPPRRLRRFDKHPLYSFRDGFLPALGSAGVLVGLTGIEDFGTAALMGVVMLLLLYVGGARGRHLALLAVLGAVAAAGLVVTRPHRVARIASFLSREPDPSGAGYQVDQALLAIGSGGWFGRGLGAGVQKYGYLPQDNNDFILAVICEELGVAGGIAVVVLFLLYLWRGWCISRRAPDGFGRLLAIGLTLTVCLQAAFNIGVVTRSVPTKGISLPLVSAGGSGVVFLGAATGLLASIGRRSESLRGQTPLG